MKKTHECDTEDIVYFAMGVLVIGALLGAMTFDLVISDERYLGQAICDEQYNNTRYNGVSNGIIECENTDTVDTFDGVYTRKLPVK